MIHRTHRTMVRMSAALAFLASGLLAPAAALAQSGMLDQTSPYPSGNGQASFNFDASSLLWQQQIKAGIAGKLEGITVLFSGPTGGSFDLRVRLGAAPSTQPILFQKSVVKTMGGNESQFVDMTAANITLTVNTLYVMEVQGKGQGISGLGSYIAPPGTPLYPEPLYLNSNPHAGGGWRLAFSTYMVSACAVGMACNDNNLCTMGDACNANGACVGMPVVCSPADVCHVAGACDPGTGMCSTPAAPDDTACNDDDACTQVDACQGGVCTGASPVTCMPIDACHEAGACDPATGDCSTPAAPDDAACDDGNACTQVDTCQSGMCSGGSPVTCPPADACHEAGACNPQSGVCEAASLPDGTPCPNGTCMAGVCEGPTTSSSSSSSSSAGAGGAGTGGAGASSSSSSSTGGAGSGGSSSSSAGGAGTSSSSSSSSSSISAGAGGGGGDGTGGTVNEEGGCGCRMAGAPTSGAPIVLLAGLALAAVRRRRSR